MYFSLSAFITELLFSMHAQKNTQLAPKCSDFIELPSPNKFTTVIEGSTLLMVVRTTSDHADKP